MFNVVSGRSKRRVWSPTTIAASVAVHVLLLGGVVYGATTAPIAEPKEPEIRWQDIAEPEQPEPKPQPPEPAPPAPEPEDPSEPVPTPGPNVAIVPPVDVPTTIAPPDPNQRPITPEQVRGIGPDGDVFGPRPAEPTPLTGNTDPAPPEEFIPDENMVEVRPVLDRSGVGRLLERYYPSILRDSRVEGRVEVEFVVNEDGRVRPGSATIVSTSHPAFGDATLRAVERMRFRPARIGNQPVPVRVTLPIVWSIAN